LDEEDQELLDDLNSLMGRKFSMGKEIKRTLNNETKEEEGVWVLDNDNFDEFVTKHTYTMVGFFSPHCSHCKALLPQYE